MDPLSKVFARHSHQVEFSGNEGRVFAVADPTKIRRTGVCEQCGVGRENNQNCKFILCVLAEGDFSAIPVVQHLRQETRQDGSG